MVKKIVKSDFVLAPVALISFTDSDKKEYTLPVIGAGTMNTKPAMAYVTLPSSEFSNSILRKTKEFVINLISTDQLKVVDTSLVHPNRPSLPFTKLEAATINTSIIEDCPINVECKVKQIIPLEDQDLFLAEITALQVDENCLDEYGRLNLTDAKLVLYVQKHYLELKEIIETYGYSVRRKTLKDRQKEAGKTSLLEK